MRKKKKGSIFIEFLAVLPTFFLVGWGTIQVLFYIMSQATIHQAAMDGARIVAVELRGETGKINTLDSTKQADIETKIKQRIKNATQFNNLILLFKDEDGNELDLGSVDYILEDKDACESAMDGNAAQKRVICVYTEEKIAGADPNVTIDQQQIIVKVKSEFNIVGNWIPGIKGKLFTRGFGASQKEQADRFQYIN